MGERKNICGPRNVLMEAARVGMSATVVDLVEQGKVNVNAQDGNDRTAIMHAARGAHLNILKYLLQNLIQKKLKQFR